MVDKAKKPGPNDPTAAQSMALGNAVWTAYRRGWDGKMGSENTPFLYVGGWNVTGVPLGTRKACVRKMLCEEVERRGSSGIWYWLTETGIAAGLADYARRHQGEHPKAKVDADAKEAKRKQEERKAKVKHAKHLFRGLKLERGAGGKKSISAAIDMDGELKLNLDDLIVLGEGIEKLRS